MIRITQQLEEIREFWCWFGSAREQLEALLNKGDTGQIAHIVSPKISAITDQIGWEIGPGLKKPYSFAVTLNGSLDNLPISEAIIKEAPILADWEMHAGRPPKDWDGRFSLKNKKGQVVALDSSTWHYILTAFDGGRFFDIGVIAQWPNMDALAKQQAATLAVQSFVGEVEMLKKFDRVEIIESPSPEELARSSSFTNLQKHLEHLEAITKEV